MFNCMLATGWYSCFYFVCLILFGFIILMNLFQAILIGNFEEASVIMRDTKFLKRLQEASEEPTDSTSGTQEIDVNKSQL
jgi:5-bromo-4-chloroindolyl phosphate hydrolysis protein